MRGRGTRPRPRPRRAETAARRRPQPPAPGPAALSVQKTRGGGGRRHWGSLQCRGARAALTPVSARTRARRSAAPARRRPLKGKLGQRTLEKSSRSAPASSTVNSGRRSPRGEPLRRPRRRTRPAGAGRPQSLPHLPTRISLRATQCLGPSLPNTASEWTNSQRQ